MNTHPKITIGSWFFSKSDNSIPRPLYFKIHSICAQFVEQILVFGPCCESWNDESFLLLNIFITLYHYNFFCIIWYCFNTPSIICRVVNCYYILYICHYAIFHNDLIKMYWVYNTYLLYRPFFSLHKYATNAAVTTE